MDEQTPVKMKGEMGPKTYTQYFFALTAIQYSGCASLDLVHRTETSCDDCCRNTSEAIQSTDAQSGMCEAEPSDDSIVVFETKSVVASTKPKTCDYQMVGGCRLVRTTKSVDRRLRGVCCATHPL